MAAACLLKETVVGRLPPQIQYPWSWIIILPLSHLSYMSPTWKEKHNLLSAAEFATWRNGTLYQKDMIVVITNSVHNEFCARFDISLLRFRRGMFMIDSQCPRVSSSETFQVLTNEHLDDGLVSTTGNTDIECFQAFRELHQQHGRKRKKYLADDQYSYQQPKQKRKALLLGVNDNPSLFGDTMV